MEGERAPPSAGATKVGLYLGACEDYNDRYTGSAKTIFQELRGGCIENVLCKDSIK